MEFFNVLSVDETKKLMLEKFNNVEIESETVDILKGQDRVLYKDVISHNNVPNFDRSTVDGYAIKSSDSHGATEAIPSVLNLLGEVHMGETTDKIIKSGGAIYVPTGGMIPKGADGVVMIENVEKLDNDTIFVHKPISFGENIIYKGSDIKKGENLFTRGKRLTPQDIGALSAIGISKVVVYKKIKFYVISTGDEIVDIDEEVTIGKVRDINGYALHSLVEKIGGEIVNKTIVRDDFQLLKSEVKKGIKESDIVLISGGSSVGTRDYTKDVMDSFNGEGVFVHGVSIKPGKPTLIGEGNGKIIFGLPGHPVSSIIIFKVFVQYITEKILGLNGNINKTMGIMNSNVHSNPGKETYQMVKIEDTNGQTYINPIFGKSGMITLLSKADGYIIIKSHEEGVNKGDKKEVYFL
ncbi:molybdopterin molybdotransferase MoeA [Dethiothermospora halolimnae]|uniref:molybdopterin molybdotransferase MoeA n=1 Tax=Dethiothermospora halolimnae TaxID=3114390 RepID=UPI003CCBA693